MTDLCSTTSSDQPLQGVPDVSEVPNADQYGVVWSRPTTYEVCAVPTSDPEYYDFAIMVEHRGEDLWAITRHRNVMNASGQWEYEPSPSNREEDFLARFRFDLETALALAKQHAPAVTSGRVRGAQGLLEWRREHPGS